MSSWKDVTYKSDKGKKAPRHRDGAASGGDRSWREVADQQCNFCHLFGLGKAPAFRKLARQEPWTGRSLAEMQRRGHENARRYGHQMSPVGLTREQFEALAVYVNSLK
ncbi:MAG TPA: c-type cytochrome [Stellaceae bacterium]|nr:c-type cytochrome [Stellaceae bacterium]